VDDILAELRGWMRPPEIGSASPAASVQPARAVTLSAQQAPVFEAIGFQPTPLDCIIDRAQQPLPAILVALAELELAGVIENRAGNYLRCADACVEPTG
jgi:predicted Rossmann fold nucleotide-binding protein DprA/Smf involved in DNA uptake